MSKFIGYDDQALELDSKSRPMLAPYAVNPVNSLVNIPVVYIEKGDGNFLLSSLDKCTSTLRSV
jgi:hypothetical protein